MPADAPDPQASESLLRSVHAGDANALHSLLVRHLAPLRAYVRLQLSPELRARDAESDLVQSVCREVLQQAERFEFLGEPQFRSWLFQAVLNKIRDRERFYRAKKRADAPLPRGGSVDAIAEQYRTLCTPSRIAEAAEQLRLTEEAFGRLPPRYAEVLTLVKLVGLERSEIAARLGTTPEGVSNLLRRAQIRLAHALEDVERDRS